MPATIRGTQPLPHARNPARRAANDDSTAAPDRLAAELLELLLELATRGGSRTNVLGIARHLELLACCRSASPLLSDAGARLHRRWIGFLADIEESNRRPARSGTTIHRPAADGGANDPSPQETSS
jgi:hypothetical protein